MKLADLRKLSIRKNLKIRFQLSNGLECVVTEHGLAQVPALHRTADFNLEQELESVHQFVLEPVTTAKKAPPAIQQIDREALAAMIGSGPAVAAADHEDE